MHREEGCFLSADGRAQIHTVLWLPEGEPIGVIQIVHGMQEYILRYEPMAAYFCGHGYAVCGHDHLGHGQSLIDGRRGYFGEQDPTGTLVEDVHRLRAKMQERFAGLPYFLFGHSMGSFIARLYLTRHAEGLAGAVICGTAGPNPAAKPAMALLRAEWALRGGDAVDMRLARMIPNGYNKRFSAEGKNAWLSRVHEVCEAFNRDPQTQFPFSVSALWTLLDLLSCVSRRDWPQKVPKALPILLTAGADDPVGNFGEGVRTVYDRMMQRGFDDLEIRLYYDCRHELMNEENREEVFADWLAWLDARR